MIEPFGRRGIIILTVLVLVNILNFLDRQLPFILVDAIRADLNLSDKQIGLMAGVTFAVVYSSAGLVLAQLADRISPRGVIAASLGFWSLMTAAGGIAQNFTHLILARVGVAAGEAGCTPASHALIARVFPASRRAMVLAIFSLGVPIGTMLGLGLGGWINDVANWRVAFFVVGLPGLLVALLAWLLLPKVPDQAPTDLAPKNYLQGVKYLFRLRTFRHMAAASALYACGSYAVGVFAPAFLMRTHGLSTAQAGLAIGLAFGGGGLLGTLAGGALTDWLGNRDPRWRQLIPAIGMLLAAPCALGAFLIPNAAASVALLTLAYLLSLLYYAPTFAVAQSLVPNEIRATAAAVLLFCLTLVGSSVGPLGIGWASDLLAPQYGVFSLRYAMCLMAITMLWSAWHFLLASRALPADLLEAERGQQTPSLA